MKVTYYDDPFTAGEVDWSKEDDECLWEARASREPPICEICGRRIVEPNFIVDHTIGIFNQEEFFVDARCELDRLIDDYLQFSEDFDSIEFHVELLGRINKLTARLKGYE